jgi:Pyruvate/2-oxoacid:ferredoxin oxidoreductase delta subunit
MINNNDVYQSLFDMYAQWPFAAEKVKDSFMALLRVQFTPEEADLAVKIGFLNTKLDQIQERTGIEKEKLRKMLCTMADKGTMWISPGGVEDPDYRTLFIGGPGLVETGGWGNIRFPHSVQLMKALHKFEVEFATKSLPEISYPVPVWTTPAALPKDATPKENVAERIKNAGYWGVSTCSCRLPHWIADPGNHCDHLLETCIFMGETARWGVEHGMCRAISYEEAIEVLRKSNKDGLVHTYDPLDFICNCCTDCCVFFVCLKKTGVNVLTPSPFVAQIDESTCNACSDCVDRCPFDAIEVDDCAHVDTHKCLGCGVCFSTCSMGSVQLVRRSKS